MSTLEKSPFLLTQKRVEGQRNDRRTALAVARSSP